MCNNNPIIQPQENKRNIEFLYFHRSISKKYGTKENHFSYKKVGFLRDCFYHLGLNKKQTLERIEDMMYRSHSKRKHPISWYLHLYNFMKGCSEENWKDINRPIRVT